MLCVLVGLTFFFPLLISDLLLSLIFTAVWANTVSEVMTVLFETDCITNSITEHMSKIIACDILKSYSWIYNLTIILWWHGELDSLFWGDQAITINQWKQKSSQCLRISFWYCIIGHNILSAHYQRLCSINEVHWFHPSQWLIWTDGESQTVEAAGQLIYKLFHITCDFWDLSISEL